MFWTELYCKIQSVMTIVGLVILGIAVLVMLAMMLVNYYKCRPKTKRKCKITEPERGYIVNDVLVTKEALELLYSNQTENGDKRR